MREQSPRHQREFPDRVFGMLPDHWNGLRPGDVVSRRPVGLPFGSVEVFLDDLLSPRQSVAFRT